MASCSQLGDIKFMIENGQHITYRWLSNNMNIDICQAKSLLGEYIQTQNNNLNACHMVSGELQNSEKVIAVVEGSHLKETEKLFEKCSSQIYSIQKQSSMNIFSQICAVDAELIADRLQDNDFLMNTSSRIRYPDVSIRPFGARRAISDVGVQLKDSIKENIKEKSSNIATSNAPKKSVTAASFFKSGGNTTSKKIVEKQEATETSGKVSENKLPKQDSTKTSVASKSNIVEEPKKSPAPMVSSEKAPSDEAVKSSKVGSSEDNDSDAEWDDGTGFVHKPKVKACPSSSVDKIFDAKAGAPDDEDVSEEVQDSPPQEDKKRPAKAAVFGAMNDFVSTVPEAAASDGATKKKRRVLVEKMFSDEKGYLVTEMVWEEVSDNESPPAAPDVGRKQVDAGTKKVQGSGNADKDVKDGDGGGKQTQKKNAGSQKSISSFFGKKS